MSAYYNECDPYAAAWLRNLVAAGHIAPGEVDERSITEISPDDLRGYTQCHFFAGIGVWSHALRRAGWSDDRAVWTGSCPCQPFSAAGKQQGFDDARHLWPVWFDLIRERRPPVVLGEQVASALGWFDLVSSDLEDAGYAAGAADLCAAGFSGAHIRQRLYFVGLGDGLREGLEGHAGDGPDEVRRSEPGGSTAKAACLGRMAYPHDGQRQRLADGQGRELDGPPTGRQQSDGEPATGGELLGLADTDGGNASAEREQRSREHGQFAADCGCGVERTPAPLLGRHPVDWLFCRDGKWRPVGPGTFPLADAAPGRVGRLRAYGNALDAETAAEFCGAVADLIH